MKRYTWIVRVTIDETWIEDGFNLTDDRAHDIFCKALPYAYGGEISTKVIKAPSAATIRKAQGYDK